MKSHFAGHWAAYLIGVGLVAGITVIGAVLLRSLPMFDLSSVDMLYLLVVAIAAVFLGFGPAMTVTILSALAFDFFLIPPVLTFTVAAEQNSVNLLVFVIVAAAISCLSPEFRR